MIVDIHSHVLPSAAATRMQRESAEHGPRFEQETEDAATLVAGPVRYDGFRRGGWDVDRRIAMLDTKGIDVQVVSPIPFTFYYGLDLGLATTFAQIQNEEIAAFVRRYPTRLAGLATLPMQDPEAAAVELRRAMGDLGLRGAELGTHIQGKNFDAPELDPFWQAAQETGAF